MSNMLLLKSECFCLGSGFRVKICFEVRVRKRKMFGV